MRYTVTFLLIIKFNLLYVTMDETTPKVMKNLPLARIKREGAISQSSSIDVYDDYQESDTDDETGLSQPPLPQQFVQDLDNALRGFTRHDYVQEVLRLCSNDYNRLDEYRHRLAERARTLQDCPNTRLMNRRNSAHASKEKKYATDCYTLNAFLCGEKSKDLVDMFTPECNNESVISEPLRVRESTEPPDFFAILTNINSDISQIATNYNLLNGTMRSVLARLPDSTATSDINKVQTEVKRLGSSIATLNKKMIDCSSSTASVTQTATPETQSEECDTPLEGMTIIKAIDVNTFKTESFTAMQRDTLMQKGIEDNHIIYLPPVI